MSALLSADDLNDFISPGVACIKPVEIKNAVPRNSNAEDDEMEIEISIDGVPMEVSKDSERVQGKPLEQAQISLSDCLACSGCITSAEEVLVAQHSHKELVNALKQHKGTKKFVASVSHQMRASVAGAYNMDIKTADKFLVNLLVNKLGFSHVVGCGLGRKISLQQSSAELVQRKARGSIGSPILSSACPGFVLYAEKTHPELISRLSTVKSPQQITGIILKKIMSLQYGVPEKDIYHLSVMPCFDKKLEAARPEEYGPDEDFKDVDCVITAKELVQLLMDEQFDVQSLIEEVQRDETDIAEVYKTFAPMNWPYPVESWLNDDGSSSGGYGLQYLLNYREYLLNERRFNPEQLSIVQVAGRNSDIMELRLMDVENDDKLASSAVVNGFRNIQNIVRKLKTGGSSMKKTKNLISRRKHRDNIVETSNKREDVADASTCDYVEVMACPNGCINGGGQIAAPEDVNIKNWIQSVQSLYYSIPISTVQDLDRWLLRFGDEFHLTQDRMTKCGFSRRDQNENSGIPAALAVGSKW